MKNKRMIQIVRSVKGTLMAHPDNEENSEFADRISSLEELEQALDKTEPIFQDTYGTPVVAGDIVLIEWHYNYHTYNGKRAIVSWDSRNGSYRFVLEERPKQFPSGFHELHSFKKLEK